MSLLSRLFGAGGPPDRYRTESEYKRNRQRQAARARELAAELGGGAATLAFAFRAGKRARSKELVRALAQRGVEASYGGGADGTFVVEGRFELPSTSEEALVQWTDDLCRFGYEYDAEFEGGRPT